MIGIKFFFEFILKTSLHNLLKQLLTVQKVFFIQKLKNKMFCSDYDVVEDTAELPSQGITDEDTTDDNSKVISKFWF